MLAVPSPDDADLSYFEAGGAAPLWAGNKERQLRNDGGSGKMVNDP